MTSGLLASETSLAATHDVGLIDLDGVVYVGSQPVPGAAATISAARDAGMRVAFTTNNASRTPAVVAAALTDMGISAVPDDVVTAGLAVAALLAQSVPIGAPVLVTGASALREAVTAQGFRLVDSAAEQPAAVVSGYDATINYDRLAEAALAVRAGATWLAANLDATIPTARGLLPGNGALVAAVAVATGARPVSAGKPEPALFQEAVRRTAARRPLVVGDRLDTDMAGAAAAGITGLLVLTGVATALDLLRAEPPARPRYLAADVSGLLVPHPAPRISNGVASCGDWAATLVGREVRVRRVPGSSAGAGTDAPDARGRGGAPGRGEPGTIRGGVADGDGTDGMDGLRAACAITWAAADAGRLPSELHLSGLSLPDKKLEPRVPQRGRTQRVER